MTENLDFLEEETTDEKTGEQEEQAAAAESEAQQEITHAENVDEQVKEKAVEPADIVGLRKALEAEIAKARNARRQLEEKINPKEEAEEQPNYYDDPDKAISQVERRIRAEVTKARLDLSESFAREKYQDFDEKLEVFDGMIRENPELHREMLNSQNPALFVYRKAEQKIKMEKFKDPDQFEKTTKELARAEVEKEYKAKFDALQKKLDEALKKQGIPTSLADARGSGGPKIKNEPSSLDDVLPKR
jgi:hypothetical protein